MQKKFTLYFISILLLAGLISPVKCYSQNASSKSNKLNPGLNIPDDIVKELDGAYSIITVDNGEPQELAIKFKEGRITTVVLNGQEIPKEKWSQYEKLIKEYIEYIDPGESSVYRYKDWHEIEYELKQDFKKLHNQIKELEINKKIKKFYDEEMREWVEELEKEINESELIEDMERIFDEFMNDLDEFLAERKAYFREMEEKEKEK